MNGGEPRPEPDHRREREPDPRWKLLPHDPARFFGLTPGFDRKDLKRSYNAWLRRFRPERFPKEFQRIRAAYEALDEQLRYASADASTDAWEDRSFEDMSAALSDAAADRPERWLREQAPGRTFTEELVEQGAEAIAAELLSRNEKTALDHFRLALLSDVAKDAVNDTAEGFVAHLVEGLRRWPEARELRALLYAYCHRPAALEEADWLLPVLASLRQPGTFGVVSERLWLQHLRRVPWREFVALYDQCRRRLAGEHDPATWTLAARLFRAAIFIADDEWTSEQWEYLQEVSADGDLEDDDELLLNELLYEYRLQRDDFLDGSDVRERIDRTLREIASGDVEAADRAFLALQIEIAAHPDRILAAFSFPGGDHFAAVALLQKHGSEMAERLDPVEPLTEDETEEHVVGLLRRIERLTDRSAVGILFGCFGVFMVLAIPVFLFGVGWYLAAQLGTLSLAVPVFVSWVVVCVLLLCTFGIRLFRRYHLQAGRVQHCWIWRREISSFLLQTGISHERLLATIPVVDDQGLSHNNTIMEMLALDEGLALIALARGV